MEIQELIFYYLHENTNTVEVQFRMSNDSDEVLRSDIVDITGSENFGYDIIIEDLYEQDIDDDEYDFLFEDSPTIDEDNLIRFLNEYYIINPDKIPKPELV